MNGFINCVLLSAFPTETDKLVKHDVICKCPPHTCAGWIEIPSYWSTYTVLILYLHCTYTVLILYLYCTYTVLILYLYCTYAVLILYLYCTNSAIILYLYYTYTVLLLYLYCTYTVLILYLYFAVLVSPWGPGWEYSSGLHYKK